MLLYRTSPPAGSKFIEWFKELSLPTKLVVGVGVLFLGAGLVLSLPIYLRYWLAVWDASSPTRREISEDLITISRNNNSLLWKGRHKDERVLVVTWAPAGETFHESEKGERLENGDSFDTDHEIWVTVVPELKTVCERVQPRCRNSSVRLKQLLGLAPHERNAQFDEFWASSDDLFRPCPDPEVSDSACGLKPPTNADPRHPNHIEWFHKQEKRSYGPLGYPWTRLGYTYDWGNADSEIGLSEFVIKKGANVKVESVTPTEGYLR